MKVLKSMIVLSVALFSIGSFAASVQCAKEGRVLRPANKTAQSIAQDLNVTTCGGKSFKAITTKMGVSVKIVASNITSKKYESNLVESRAKKLSDIAARYQ